MKRPVKCYWKILWHLACGKVRNHKKAAGWPEISSIKKVLAKISNLHGFLMKTTKYKAIQPLYGMEPQRFYEKINLSKLTYFSVQNTKYKAIQPLFGTELQRFKRLALVTQ